MFFYFNEYVIRAKWGTPSAVATHGEFPLPLDVDESMVVISHLWSGTHSFGIRNDCVPSTGSHRCRSTPHRYRGRISEVAAKGSLPV